MIENDEAAVAATQARAFAAIKPGGKLISAVSIPDADLSAKVSVDARLFVVATTTTSSQR